MSKSEKIAVLALAVVGGVVAHKVAAKQAQALGVPALAVTVATWALSQTIG